MTGDVDVSIAAAGKLVIPGFVSTHAHVNANEGSRLIADLGRRDVMRSGFLNYTPNNGIDGRPIRSRCVRRTFHPVRLCPIDPQRHHHRTCRSEAAAATIPS